MDFTNPDVIKKHNRNAWTIRGLIILWLVICYFPATWTVNHFPQIRWGSLISPFKAVYGFIAIVLPLLAIMLYASIRWLFHTLSGRPSA